MEAGETVVKAGDALRMALTLGTHARLAEHGRNLELAQDLLKLAMADGLPPTQARRRALDVLWRFIQATGDESLADEHKALAERILHESPGYAHVNLMGSYALGATSSPRWTTSSRSTTPTGSCSSRRSKTPSAAICSWTSAPPTTSIPPRRRAISDSGTTCPAPSAPQPAHLHRLRPRRRRAHRRRGRPGDRQPR
jgi:hypothetical protein